MKVGKATSDWNVMKCGCPQGSSFGPTLWNLYQNDLSYHINEIANLNMYADDHQMYIVGSDMSIMCTNMEKGGNSAPCWGGGHLGIFWVGTCRPGLQIGTPF